MLTRRDFLTAASIPFLAGCSRGPSHGRTNVLFIAVDDLRPQLGCYGKSQIQSPNIDLLASNGIRFDRAYCQQAVCAPSRISLLTGLRPDSTTIYDLNHPMRQVIPEVISLPHHFRNNGYQTVSLGKIYHHQNDDPEAWSAPDWRPKGDWAGRGYRDPESARLVAESDAKTKAEYEAALAAGKQLNEPASGRGPAYEAPDVADSDYPDGMVADQAIRELRRLRDEPFFLAAGFFKPHLPFNAPRKYWDLYSPDALEIPSQSDWPRGAPEIARSNWGELRNYVGIPADGPVSEELARALIHGYYACVSYMDAQVGRVLDELASLGLAERTAVVLWGDHGWKLNDYRAWCKHTNFEIDTHVPMILSAPGRHGGQSTGALVEFVDIYPTLAELCGLDIPAHCEGTSMVPLLEDPAREWKRAAFSQYPRGRDRMGYSIRSGQWRYTEWIARDTGEIAARELYDHSAGPLAARNEAADPARAGIVQELSALLAKGQGWKAVREAL